MYTYILECWNPVSQKYIERWKGNNLERAEIMFNKGYFRRTTRRLIRIQTEILYSQRAERK